MRYPTLTKSDTEKLVARLVADDGAETNSNADLTWVGGGDDVDLSGVDEMFAQLREEFAVFQEGPQADQFEVFEGLAAGQVHRAFRDLPIVVLDDPGFWRYVSIAKFWWFIRNREQKPIANGNHMTYVDGSHPTECVPLRMFLRAQAIRDGDDYSLAPSLERATDFWRSHILRVQTASAPPLARGFARLQAVKQMPTEAELRPFARRVNRLWANVVLHTASEKEAAELLAELYESGPGSARATGDAP